MGRVKREPGGVETAVSWGILGLLAVVAAAVLIKQFQYDPATVVFLPKEIGPAKTADQKDAHLSDLSQFAPENLVPAGPRENFGPANLAEKINGKAELYFSAGFVSLVSRRFQIKNDPQSWMEFYVYNMGSHEQAFAVYSLQLRGGAETLALTPFSYRTGNALFFVHDRYYIEAVAAVSSDVMAVAMETLGRKFVEKTPSDGAVIKEIALFPREGLVDGSIAFLVANAFGFQGMERIFTATYQVQGREVTAFLSKRKDEKEARELVAAYRDFLIAYGGKISEKVVVPDGVTIDMLGDLEVFFTNGIYVAGVRETDSWEVVEELAKRLLNQLGSN